MPDHSKESHQLNLQSVHHQVLLDNLPVGVFLVGETEQVLVLNHALAEFLEAPQERFLAEPYRKLFGRISELSSTPDVTWQELIAAALDRQDNPCVYFSIEREQKKLWKLSFFVIPAQQGLSQVWGGLLQDDTEARQQSDLQGDAYQSLLNGIRSPLASLHGYSTSLLNNYQSWENDLVFEFIGTMDQKVNELVKRVDQNLALLRIEQGKLNLNTESVDITSLIQEIMAEIGKKLPSSKIEFQSPSEISFARVDAARIKKILSTLLRDLIQANPSDAQIEIFLQSEGNWAKISVQSPGYLLSEEEQQEIFRKDNVTRLPSGAKTNLNLYLSRKIIEAHGGKMWVESPLPKLGQGLKTSFTLPLMPQQLAARITTKRPGSGQAIEKHVLVVDDRSDTQSLLLSILQNEGYTVDLAPDGRTALDIVQTSPPDLVVVDWSLPDMSGLSLCRNIQRWATTPIMMMSSRTSPDDLVSAFRAGADDYLRRPFLSDELIARVHALMRRPQSEQSPKQGDVFTTAGLRIDFDAHEVWARGEYVELTPIEYRLLAYMARHPRLVLSYDRLMGRIWDSPEAGSKRGLFAHISRLRKKIEANPEDPELICTRWGVGYIFMPSNSA